MGPTGAWACTRGGAGGDGDGDGGGGVGSGGGGQSATDLGAPRPIDLDTVLDELGDQPDEGEYETSEGTVVVRAADCEQCPADQSRAYHFCSGSGYGWIDCVNPGGGLACFYVEVPEVPFGTCGGYYYDPWPDNDIGNSARRECTDLGDFRVRCAFPGVVDERVTHCYPANCLCTTMGGCFTDEVEFCVVMDNVITPENRGYWASYYQSGDRQTAPVLDIVAPAPNCAELGIGGGGGSDVGRDGAIAKQCAEIAVCSGVNAVAQCMSDLADFYDSASPDMQAQLRQLVAECSHLSGCEYLDCSAI